MSPKLGTFIQHHPWLIVFITLAITIGFSLFIPSIEYKTDFADFSPDDPLVQANTRIQEYLGGNQQLMYMLLEKEDTHSVITPDALREMAYLAHELEKLPEVNWSFSLVTFLDTICLIEFGDSLNNCTDEQITIALDDLLVVQEKNAIALFAENDPNEDIDYQRFPRLSKGSSVDGADIKNCYFHTRNDSLRITFEVYDLSKLDSTLRPVFPHVNVMEWYVTFNNLITPIEALNITYSLSGHLEPIHPVWEIGKGFRSNIKDLFSHLRNHTLFNAYKKDVYLWVQLSGQELAFPFPLTTGSMEFDIDRNQILLDVSLEELGTYGIAPQIGSVGLPAKLSHFSSGTRYYQTPFLQLGGGRITANTSYFFQKLFAIQSKPLLGPLTERMLQRYGNLTWEEFEDFFAMLQQTDMLPDTLALQDLQDNWKQADIVPDNPVSSTISFTIVPHFYEDLQLNALSFLSADYSSTGNPSASIMFLLLTPTKVYDNIISMNKRIVENITELDETYDDVSIQVTGNGIINVQINDVTMRANRIIAPLIFLIIMVILFFTFHGTSYVVLPMLSLIISMIWTFGSMVLLGINFNVIAVAMVPLLMGLGVDYSVQMFHNYRIELEKGYSVAQATINSVRDIGSAIFLAMITTAIGFLSFLTASIGPLRDFGLLLALGILYTFITALTFLPALRYILDKRKTVSLKRKPHGIAIRKIMDILSKKIIHQEKLILAIIVILTIIFAIGATRLNRGFSMMEFAPENTQSIELFKVIAEKFPYSSQSQEYILIEGDIATVAALQGIKETHDNLYDDTFVAKNIDGSQKITSIYTFIQQSIKNDQTIIERFHINQETGIPETDADVKALYDYLYETGSMNISLDDIEIFMDGFEIDESVIPDFSIGEFIGEISTVLHKENNQYSATVINVYIDPSFPAQDGNVVDDQRLLKTELNRDISSYGDATAVATGQYIISLTITDSLTQSQILSTIATIIVSIIILILIYRNPVLGFITCMPVIISIIWILGTMYFIGYSLNVLTITVTSMTIGMGIDYAIYVTERFKLVVDKTGDVSSAVSDAISRTGGAVFISAITTVFGFIVLLFAPIPPQQQFGVILAVTITYAFVTTIFVHPIILKHWGDYRKKTKGYVISTNGLVQENGRWIEKKH